MPKHRVCSTCGKRNPSFARNYCVSCGRAFPRQKRDLARWVAIIGIVACVIIGSITATHLLIRHVPSLPNVIPNQPSTVVTQNVTPTIMTTTRTVWTTFTTSVSNAAPPESAPASGGFNLEPQATALTVYKTRTASLQMQIQSINDFAGQLELSTSGNPDGLAANYSSNPVTAGTSVVVSFSAEAYAPNGTYPVSIIATYLPSQSSSPVTRQTVIDITISDFQISLTPPGAEMQAGASTTFTVTLTLQKGFVDPVSIASVSGLPNGATYTVTASNPTILAGVPGTTEITLHIKMVTLTKIGTYPIIIAVSGGGVTHFLTAQITVL